MTPYIAYDKKILDDDLLNQFYQGKVTKKNSLSFKQKQTCPKIQYERLECFAK